MVYARKTDSRQKSFGYHSNLVADAFKSHSNRRSVLILSMLKECLELG